MKQYSIALASLFAANLSGISLVQAQASAATAEQEHWYAVEVIAFKRLQINQNERPINLERLSLSYPTNSMSIINAETAAELNTQQKTEAIASSDSNTTIASFNGDSTQGDSGTLTHAPLMSKTLMPGTFLVATPRAEQELNPQASSLARSRNQRVLFHHRWNLQLPPQQKKYNIAINGGESFGDHQELEGYIQLSRSRYLHIETNVWLSQFAMAQAEDFGRWLDLPERPSPFEVIAPKNPTELSLNNAWETAESISNTPEAIRPTELQQTTASNYVVNSIEQLQQKRRMRSGELHYIDHPAFGLLVKLSPIETPVWPFDNSLLPILPKPDIESEIPEVENTETDSPTPAGISLRGSK
ncbi:CsiV family protein [uncultured Pseudoteredinibacter sp.]|uniref:CsiV family protein n=1 Tax=uncultured Pseudoteredinibacter sp. TaxID=1641701 RepID=UPI00262B8DAA|nr:CsiV family protein [uncultured Pseudoteredinibacter sp.]